MLDIFESESFIKIYDERCDESTVIKLHSLFDNPLSSLSDCVIVDYQITQFSKKDDCECEEVAKYKMGNNNDYNHFEELLKKSVEINKFRTDLIILFKK